MIDLVDCCFLRADALTECLQRNIEADLIPESKALHHRFRCAIDADGDAFNQRLLSPFGVCGLR